MCNEFLRIWGPMEMVKRSLFSTFNGIWLNVSMNICFQTNGTIGFGSLNFYFFSYPEWTKNSRDKFVKWPYLRVLFSPLPPISISNLVIFIKWPYRWVLLPPITPYFNFEPCYFEVNYFYWRRVKFNIIVFNAWDSK